MNRIWLIFAAAAFGVLPMGISSTIAADPAPAAPGARDTADRKDASGVRDVTKDVRGTVENFGKPKVDRTKAVRASEIIGMKVRNAQNEELGSVHDLVLNYRDGSISYAALSFGGFLKIRDKLLAVPWDALQVTTGENGKMHLTLNVSKERLEKAPGFDQSHWPTTADAHWDSVDKYYESDTSTRTNQNTRNQNTTSTGTSKTVTPAPAPVPQK